MASVTRAEDVSGWIAVVLQLISIGATTYARITQAMIDAGHAADDARLLGLQVEYEARIARARRDAGMPVSG